MKNLKDRLLDFLSNKFVGLIITSFLIFTMINNNIKDFKAYSVLAIIYIFYCLSNAMIKYFISKFTDAYKNKD